MSTRIYTNEILATEYIGDSLAVINSNSQRLDTAVQSVSAAVTSNVTSLSSSVTVLQANLPKAMAVVQLQSVPTSAPTVVSQHNISSFAWLSGNSTVAVYRATFTTPLENANYMYQLSARRRTGQPNPSTQTYVAELGSQAEAKTTTHFDVRTSVSNSVTDVFEFNILVQ